MVIVLQFAAAALKLGLIHGVCKGSLTPGIIADQCCVHLQQHIALAIVVYRAVLGSAGKAAAHERFFGCLAVRRVNEQINVAH